MNNKRNKILIALKPITIVTDIYCDPPPPKWTKFVNLYINQFGPFILFCGGGGHFLPSVMIFVFVLRYLFLKINIFTEQKKKYPSKTSQLFDALDYELGHEYLYLSTPKSNIQHSNVLKEHL